MQTHLARNGCGLDRMAAAMEVVRGAQLLYVI